MFSDREREREREREKWVTRTQVRQICMYVESVSDMYGNNHVDVCFCVCVCICMCDKQPMRTPGSALQKSAMRSGAVRIAGRTPASRLKPMKLVEEAENTAPDADVPVVMVEEEVSPVTEEDIHAQEEQEPQPQEDAAAEPEHAVDCLIRIMSDLIEDEKDAATPKVNTSDHNDTIDTDDALPDDHEQEEAQDGFASPVALAVVPAETAVANDQQAAPVMPKTPRSALKSTSKGIGSAMRVHRPATEATGGVRFNLDVADADDAAGSERAVFSSSKLVLTPVRASKKQGMAMGSSVVLTPVRRSTRTPTATPSSVKMCADSSGHIVVDDKTTAPASSSAEDDAGAATSANAVKALLEQNNFAYMPNPALAVGISRDNVNDKEEEETTSEEDGDMHVSDVPASIAAKDDATAETDDMNNDVAEPEPAMTDVACPIAERSAEQEPEAVSEEVSTVPAVVVDAPSTSSVTDDCVNAQDEPSVVASVNEPTPAVAEDIGVTEEVAEDAPAPPSPVVLRRSTRSRAKAPSASADTTTTSSKTSATTKTAAKKKAPAAKRAPAAATKKPTTTTAAVASKKKKAATVVEAEPESAVRRSSRIRAKKQS